MQLRVEKLEPMRVASVRAIGKSPETEAWQRLRAWAEPAGLLTSLDRHPVFGFNNPNPEPGQAEYGYEFWIRIDPETEVGDGIEVKEFSGGLYAISTWQAAEKPFQDIRRAWEDLGERVSASIYGFGEHQWLEKPHTPGARLEELILDLYCPVTELPADG